MITINKKILILSFVSVFFISKVFAADAKKTETEVIIKISQSFVTDAERKANQRKFEGMNEQAALQIKEREGVWNRISTQGKDLAELLEMSRNYKEVLEKGVTRIEQMRLSERFNAYTRLMEQVVVESKSTSSELLMRYALNRGMAAQELFSQDRNNVRSEMSKEALKALELRVLRDAVSRAIALYEKDERFLDILKTSKSDIEKNAEMRNKYGFDLFEVSKLEYEREYANYIIELTTNAPTHNGTFLLLKYTLVQLFNGVNSSLLRNQSEKLRNILRNLLELGIELPNELPKDPMQAHMLNNMTKDNLEIIIKDYNKAIDMMKAELSKFDSKIKAEFEMQKMDAAKKAAAIKKQEDDRLAEIKRVEDEVKRKENERLESARVEVERKKFYTEFSNSKLYKTFFRTFKKGDEHNDLDYEGRVFTSPAGRTMIFTLNLKEQDLTKRVSIAYYHGGYTYSSRSFELIDNIILVQMSNNQRWTIKSVKENNCFNLMWAEGSNENLCDNSVSLSSGIDLRGTYVSETTSRYIRLQGTKERPTATYYHGNRVQGGPFTPTYINSSAIHYNQSRPHNLTLLFTSKDCFVFTWSSEGQDVLCRASDKTNIVPYGFYKSKERTLIFRSNNGNLTMEQSLNGQNQYPVVLENGVGFLDAFNWGFKIEDKNCLTIYHNVGLKDKVCKEQPSED